MGQNADEMQPRCSQNSVKGQLKCSKMKLMQPKCSQNSVKIQPKFGQNAIKMQLKWSQNAAKKQSKFTQNSLKIHSKFTQNSAIMQQKFRLKQSQCNCRTYSNSTEMVQICHYVTPYNLHLNLRHENTAYLKTFDTGCVILFSQR